MRIRDQNTSVEHLYPILSTRAKKYSSCQASWSNRLLFFSAGSTLPAFLCWLPCLLEGTPSLTFYLDGTLWSLAAKKKRAISFQEVGTCQRGDCRGAPAGLGGFAVCLQPCLLSLCLSVLSQDAFSLLAYSDPWNCPVGQQLDPIQREPVCAALNSAILGKIWFLWECFSRYTCSQGLSCGRQACEC